MTIDSVTFTGLLRRISGVDASTVLDNFPLNVPQTNIAPVRNIKLSIAPAAVDVEQVLSADMPLGIRILAVRAYSPVTVKVGTIGDTALPVEELLVLSTSGLTPLSLFFSNPGTLPADVEIWVGGNAT